MGVEHGKIQPKDNMLIGGWMGWWWRPEVDGSRASLCSGPGSAQGTSTGPVTRRSASSCGHREAPHPSPHTHTHCRSLGIIKWNQNQRQLILSHKTTAYRTGSGWRSSLIHLNRSWFLHKTPGCKGRRGGPRRRWSCSHPRPWDTSPPPSPLPHARSLQFSLVLFRNEYAGTTLFGVVWRICIETIYLRKPFDIKVPVHFRLSFIPVGNFDQYSSNC